MEFDLLILSIEYDFSMAETNKHRGSAQKSADLTPVDECYPPAASVGMLKTFLASVLSSDCRIQFAVLVFVLLWYGAFLSISWRWALNDPERKSGIVARKRSGTNISIGCPSNSERG